MSDSGVAEFDTSELDRLKQAWYESNAEEKRTAKLSVIARGAVFAEEMRLKALGWNAPYPLGSVLYQWTRNFGKPVTRTGLCGAVELVTEESKSTLARNKSVNVGSFIVRLRKPDGSTGKAFEELTTWNKDRWFPEGVTPDPRPELRV